MTIDELSDELDRAMTASRTAGAQAVGSLEALVKAGAIPTWARKQVDDVISDWHREVANAAAAAKTILAQ
jgi:hypothetical protein